MTVRELNRVPKQQIISAGAAAANPEWEKRGGSLIESPPSSGVYACTYMGGCGWRGAPTFCDGEIDLHCPSCEREEEVRQKVGRNEPCPCGSGTKYKKCHGR